MKKRVVRSKHLFLGISLFMIGLFLVIAFFSKIDFQDKIALIPIEGTIGFSDGLGSVGVYPEDVISDIDKANKDSSIKAIILEINSPGGTVVASEEIAKAVKNSKKPVVALIHEVGASGAYWIASASDKIVASEMSVTGSIGVISSYVEFSQLMEKYGITYNDLKAGKYKDIGSPYKELTAEEKTILESVVNKIYDHFVKQVSINRNISEAKVRELATGMIYLGNDAKEFGLIDVIGDKNKAVEIAKELAGIKKADLVKYEKEITLVDIFGKLSTNAFYFMGKGIGSEFSPSLIKQFQFTA
ncbi:MAG: signal peptide peptidase SppA [Candidatus Nanoarchaeia archaeon]|nr:signal peptide peptidase SppA [Candidatus Nanoarchaeia archaeon]